MRRVPWLFALVVFGAAVIVYVATVPAPTPSFDEPSPTAAPIYGSEVVREFPHDPTAFTQGLIYLDGFLYESTGPTGHSTIRKVRLDSGEVVLRRALDDRAFGEGLTEWRGRILQLTPIRTEVSIPSALRKMGDPAVALPELGRKFGVNVGVIYDVEKLEPQATFTYENEGWGLTHDGRRLILSDGRAWLRFIDPETFVETGRVRVTDAGKEVTFLNELEYVDGEVYANVWQTERVAVIDPESGHVKRWIDLTGLAALLMPPPDPNSGAVLNGIAYDPLRKRLFVTGKRWPIVFEIRPVLLP